MWIRPCTSGEGRAKHRVPSGTCAITYLTTHSFLSYSPFIHFHPQNVISQDWRLHCHDQIRRSAVRRRSGTGQGDSGDLELDRIADIDRDLHLDLDPNNGGTHLYHPLPRLFIIYLPTHAQLCTMV
jgi:hypothetical protein